MAYMFVVGRGGFDFVGALGSFSLLSVCVFFDIHDTRAYFLVMFLLVRLGNGRGSCSDGVLISLSNDMLGGWTVLPYLWITMFMIVAIVPCW